MKLPLVVSSSVPCPKCGKHFAISDEYIVRYFDGKTVKCPECGADLDWWSTARAVIEQNFMYSQAFAFIGKTTLFRLLLKPGERKTFKFSENGVPAGSRVLYVNYTPAGFLFPAELHGNVATRRFYTDEVTVYPVPALDEPARDTEVNVMVCWVPSSAADEAWQSLVDAFEAYAADRLKAMVVPANVAVESEMSRVVAAYMERFASEKRIGNLLRVATYWHQLHALVPMIASVNGIPKMPEAVRKALDDLIQLRNQLGHKGALNAALDKPTAATLLCGALFGLHYVRYLEQHLPQ